MPFRAKLRNLPTSQSGFTLIEILVVLVIVGFMSGVGLASYRRLQARVAVSGVAGILESQLRLARGRALAVEKPEGCGVLSSWQVYWNADEAAWRSRADCGVEGYFSEKSEPWSSTDVVVLPATGEVGFVPGAGALLEVAGNDQVSLKATGGDFDKTVIISSWGEILVN